MKTVDVSHDTEPERRQMLWADAVYIRDIACWRNLSSESLLKLALILHEQYGSFDFAAKLMQVRDERIGSDSHRAYLNRLGLLPHP
ncbi:MAG TPA: hypothetical protein VEV17_09450 [Bryobacteraceae bacterium]|nr:hypothetical protein [Bryobacteraceae bacterium]